MRKIAGAVVLILGILGLVYGGFSYTKETHDATLGPIEFQIKEKERVNIPIWAGVVGIVVGGALRFVPGKAGGGGS
jgi:hypothetical protein